MSFTPYHSFSSEPKFVRLIERLNEENKIPTEIYEGFCRYHPALTHKLRSTKYNLEQVKNKLTTTDIQEAANTKGNFLFETNMFIDGYFYNCGSALDILAHEVLLIFNQTFPSKVYFETAYKEIHRNRSGDTILTRLTRPTWKQEFSNYRNALTHELILAASYSINIENTGARQSHMIVFPLPDDPRSSRGTRTYQRNANVLEYAEENFTRVLRLINGIYSELYNRTRDNDSLPL